MFRFGDILIFPRWHGSQKAAALRLTKRSDLFGASVKAPEHSEKVIQTDLPRKPLFPGCCCDLVRAGAQRSREKTPPTQGITEMTAICQQHFSN